MRMDLMDKAILSFVLGLLALLFIGVPISSYYGAISTAEVWNECHPSVQITPKQAFFANVDISVCETGALKSE